MAYSERNQVLFKDLNQIQRLFKMTVKIQDLFKIVRTMTYLRIQEINIHNFTPRTNVNLVDFLTLQRKRKLV